MRLLLHLSWATVAFSLSGNVKGTVYMPDLKIEEERVEDGEGLKLPCATSVYTSNGSYSKWGKAWRVNGTESFDASRVTFINDNATLRIQSLHPVDHGVYECCLHAYAYEDYLCFVTKLILGDGNANWGETAVERLEPAAPPAWNVDLTGMDTLNALPNSTYFIRLFDANVTDIKCIKDGNETESLKTGNDFPNPLFTDALISTFNAALHQGMYFCNGTYHDGNQTEILHVEFEVIESIDSNLHTQLLDGELVKEYRNSQHRSLIDMALILVLFYNLCR